jgi:hypothetical protein
MICSTTSSNAEKNSADLFEKTAVDYRNIPAKNQDAVKKLNPAVASFQAKNQPSAL